ncbi:MAG: DNA polymerase Y family protein [Acidiferrobacterales bacterium]|nr:DNA polymerase Y family protein [Acidiferrobacterales bacterium]
MRKPKDAWLCIRFTHLSLNVFGIKAGAQQATVAVFYQDRIWQHNGCAAQAILYEGVTTNHALVLVPELKLHERQIAEEHKRLKSLAHWAYRFTSLVSVYENSLLLEIGKSISLFKGLEHLVNLIYSDLARFGADAKLGLGHTPQAALLLSFNAQANKDLFYANKHLTDVAQRLEQSDIVNLNVAAKTIAELQRCGFSRLGDITPIALSELGSRFGADFLNYLDRLFGRVADVQVPVIPPENFEAHVDFVEPISNIAWIEQQLERLLGDLCVFIMRRQLVCRGFTWRFFDEKNQLLKTASVGLSTHDHSDSQNLLGSMLELTHLKLETLQLTWSFSRIELLSNQLLEKQLFNNDLFDPKPDEEGFRELLNKLINRLSQNAVFQLTPRAAHLPELKNARELAITNLDTHLRGQQIKHQQILPANMSLDPQNEFKDEPIWLLNQPKLISRSLRHPEYQGVLQIIHGPNRIVSHWWSSLQSRDYYIARQRSGRLLWLFFCRRQRAWFLHGLFA